MASKATLTERHVEASFDMQLSGYYNGYKSGPNRSRYYYSKRIPSTNWNHGVFADPTVLEDRAFVVAEANSLDRPASFFVRESDIERVHGMLGDRVRVDRERWMICTPGTVPPESEDNEMVVEFAEGAVPSDDYCAVLENLFDDDGLNQRFRDFYVPTLKNAEEQTGTRVVHAVGRHKGVAVSCGSVYLRDGFAGLFSVGTVARFQRSGFGKRISRELTKFAFLYGAQEVFLQCVIGTHVEKLYESIGFVSAEVPGIVTLVNR